MAAGVHLPGGHHDHEHGGLLADGQEAQALCQHRRQPEADNVAPTAGLRRARIVGGQLQQRRRAGKLLAPVRALRLQLAAGQSRALPGAEVSVLDGQRRQ